MRHQIALISLVLFASSTSSFVFGATTRYAADVKQTSVQAAVNTAADGDTVVVPAGSTTWTSRVSIDNKAVTVVGAGVGKTVITSAIPKLATNAVFYVTSGGKPVHITGFTFVGGPYDGKGLINIVSEGFRIDNCVFNHLIRGTRGITAWSTVNSWGLVDHCVFNKAANITGGPQGVAVQGDGDAAWSRPGPVGSGRAVFIEDCTFNWPVLTDSALDIYDGGSATFRHNTVTNANVGCHGLDSGNYRSALSWEIYENTFIVNTSLPRQFCFRGGTGVVFKNKITSTTGTVKPLIVLTYYRATGTVIGSATYSQYLPWGHVTGINAYDGNTDAWGWPALDQVGSGPATVPAALESVIPTKPAAGHSVQARNPAYAWGNTIDGKPMPMGPEIYSGSGYPDGSPGHANVASLIKENRDFFNGVTKPGYTPYTYPHPLTLAATQSGPLAPPSNLQILPSP